MKIKILRPLETLIRQIKNSLNKNFRAAKKEQDRLFDLNFKDTKKMIVFVSFAENGFCGGIMAIFHFANISRQMKHIHGCEVLNANLFSKFKKYYINQPRFKNDETMYRLDLVMEKAKQLDTLILHVPEMLMEDFAKGLTPKYKEILKKVPNLQINVLNQNIEVFSPVETWSELWELTDNITQTTAFDRYTTQEVCDAYGLPLYRLIGYCDLYRGYDKVALPNKEKLFIYSPDFSPEKENILNILKEGLPDFKFQQIQGITFDEFMKTAQRAMFSLTFGEGFDGYFTNIHFTGGLGFSVYNETFFPSKKFLEFPTVYKSYEQLAENIVKDVRYYLDNPQIYKELSDKVEALNIETAYNEKLTYDLLEKFYKKEPTFLPEKIKNKRQVVK